MCVFGVCRAVYVSVLIYLNDCTLERFYPKSPEAGADKPRALVKCGDLLTYLLI